LNHLIDITTITITIPTRGPARARDLDLDRDTQSTPILVAEATADLVDDQAQDLAQQVIAIPF